ncbi:hypothetical protein [Nocardia jiangxiensis]|uniref:hypothetical protein n=1 Tax=Nocardia jiangxiensis TaxID=282685 RepID=UPI0003008994|nr:hypothetical protein [Nocardia jiangxiensis]
MSEQELPTHPYIAWEMGYAAAVANHRQGADGTPGREYTSNPYSLGDTEKDCE